MVSFKAAFKVSKHRAETDCGQKRHCGELHDLYQAKEVRKGRVERAWELGNTRAMSKESKVDETRSMWDGERGEEVERRQYQAGLYRLEDPPWSLRSALLTVQWRRTFTNSPICPFVRPVWVKRTVGIMR